MVETITQGVKLDGALPHQSQTRVWNASPLFLFDPQICLVLQGTRNCVLRAFYGCEPRHEVDGQLTQNKYNTSLHQLQRSLLWSSEVSHATIWEDDKPLAQGIFKMLTEVLGTGSQFNMSSSISMDSRFDCSLDTHKMNVLLCNTYLCKSTVKIIGLTLI